MAVLTATAGDLSKCLTNAEGWLPAKSSVPVALVVADGHSLRVTVTDTYTAGEATSPVESDRGTTELVEISRSDLAELAARARKDGAKKTLVRLTVESDKGVILHGSVDESAAETATALQAVKPGELDGVWETVAELFERGEENVTRLPDQLMVNPGYLALFNKVRPDQTGRGVDLYIGEAGKPILGKVGPNFRGLIMPMDRIKNADTLGPEGLW
ncbi:hypothetical protein [Microtetraspora malaysiensis]|uniref:hypothetical protein n=1 Tax=Microtetraspora malaysiensis TaxID=161358 RepID=UPI003D8DD9A5